MQVSEEVLGVLSALEFPTDRTVRIVEQLDRKTYSKVNEVLEAIGGKWSRKDKAHVFGSDARPRVDLVIDTGEVTTGKDLGFFPTPAPLAAELVEMAGVKLGMLVLEPSAGTGRIVDALLAVDACIVAVEREPAMRAALHAREFAEKLQPPRSGNHAWKSLKTWDGDDFMNFAPRKRFECVVMNPPFCKVGKGDHLDHVQHAFDLLETDGLLVSVLPASVNFRRDARYKEFREWVEYHGEITDLPPNSFKESGTGVNTVVVRIRK